MMQILQISCYGLYFLPSNFLHFSTHFVLTYQLLCKYSQVGTPIVKVNMSYNAKAHTYNAFWEEVEICMGCNHFLLLDGGVSLSGIVL